MVEIGEILWLRMRFNNDPGTISKTKHPYVVIRKSELGFIEVGQLDSLQGKEYKVAFKSNHLVRCEGQSAITKDGYIQMDNCFMIDDYDELSKYSRVKLTDDLTKDIVSHYNEYQSNNEISENKTVYLPKEEVDALNDT